MPDYKAAAAPSPVQTELQNQALKTLQWASKGDYTNPHDAGLFVNLGDPARAAQQAELMGNAAGQGIYGLGVADPTQLAMNKENVKAHLAQDAAGKYEDSVRQGVGAATGVAEDMSNLSAEDRRAILNAQTATYNTWQSRPQKRWFDYLLGAGSAAAPVIAAAI